MHQPNVLEGRATEQALISRILAGEKDLFEILIRRFNGGLYKIGRAYGFAHEDVQDLMQEAHVAAYQNLARFEGRSSYKTWLYRIMLNKCYHFGHRPGGRSHSVFNVSMDSDPDFASSLLPPGDARQEVLNRELGQVLEACIQKLPLEYRTVFVLRELEGLSVAQTAEAMAITETNVKVRLSRAREMLRRQIEQWYPKAAIYEFNLIYCDAMVDRVMSHI